MLRLMRAILLFAVLAAPWRASAADADGRRPDSRRADQSTESVEKASAEQIASRVLGYWTELRRESAGRVIDDPFKLHGVGLHAENMEFWDRRGELTVMDWGRRVVIDAEAAPMRMDWISENDGRVYASVGIFRFEGDSMVLVRSDWQLLGRKPLTPGPLPNRPTDFRATRENGWIKSIYRRCEYMEQD